MRIHRSDREPTESGSRAPNDSIYTSLHKHSLENGPSARDHCGRVRAVDSDQHGRRPGGGYAAPVVPLRTSSNRY